MPMAKGRSLLLLLAALLPGVSLEEIQEKTEAEFHISL